MYYIVIIKFIDFANQNLLIVIISHAGVLWSTVVQWPMRKKSRKPWAIKVDLWFMKTLMIIGMLGYRCYVVRCSILFCILILHFASQICLVHYYQRATYLLINNAGLVSWIIRINKHLDYHILSTFDFLPFRNANTPLMMQ